MTKIVLPTNGKCVNFVRNGPIGEEAKPKRGRALVKLFRYSSEPAAIQGV